MQPARDQASVCVCVLNGKPFCRLKDIKLTKARVDTHWKKQPLGISNQNANVAAAAVKTTAAGPLLRSNSIRSNVAAAGANAAGSTAAQAARQVAHANSKRK